MPQWLPSPRTSARLDIVINNAGIGAAGDVAANDDDEWHRVLDVNVVGIARVTRAALPHLRRSSRAAVVNTSSVVAAVGRPEPRALLGEQGGGLGSDPRDGRRPCPRGHPRQRGDAGNGGHALGGAAAGCRRGSGCRGIRSARPPADGAPRHRREVANAIVYLASPNASSTTGTLLGVDGGMDGLRLP